MKKRVHKKPRGSPSHYAISIGPGLPPREMEKVELVLPDEKASIEKTVAEKFAVDARDYPLPFRIISPPVQNEEDDIDFTVETNLGQMGLELVEYAPVGRSGFSGPKPTTYNFGEQGRAVLDLIAKKNEKYRNYTRFPHLMLLVYVTDDAWTLSEYALKIVQVGARTENRVFHFITYYKPMKDVGGIVFRLYPVSDSQDEALGNLRVPAEGQRIL